jgi:YgiT-type zinc finger domain-containing protein
MGRYTVKFTANADLKYFESDLKTISFCPLCGGEKTGGKTTITVDLGDGLVVIRDVPATVCALCGADWIGDAIC